MTAALYDKALEEPPPADRLRAMITALASGAEIDASLRAELIDALKRHVVRRRNDKLRARGRRIGFSTWLAARIAKELIDRRGAKTVKAAATAAAESVKWGSGLDPKSVTPEEVANVTRKYEKLNESVDGFIKVKNGKFGMALISPAWIDDAAARLSKGRKKID